MGTVLAYKDANLSSDAQFRYKKEPETESPGSHWPANYSVSLILFP